MTRRLDPNAPLRPARITDPKTAETTVSGAVDADIRRVSCELGTPRPETLRRLIADGIAVHDARAAAAAIVAGALR